MNRPISDLMQREVCCVHLDDTIEEVERTLVERKLSWLPVVESNGTAMGVISIADLLRFHADHKDAGTTCAWQLCTYKPIAVAPDTPVDEVARLMVAQGIHHVVVVDRDRLAGVVSSLDFVRAFVESAAPVAAQAPIPHDLS
jgi:CBS domain-containing protein